MHLSCTYSMSLLPDYDGLPIADILEAQQRFWAALQARDGSELAFLLAENYSCISPGQPDQNRAEFIQTLTSFPFEVASVTCENLHVTMVGNIGVLTGVQIAQMRASDAEVFTDKIAITNIFNYLDDEWQMVLSHAVTLPSDS
jgi:ketosteroid isomerase-like protein